MGWLVSDEWGIVWKKLIFAYWWYFHNLCLSETVNNYNHVNRCYGRDSNLSSPEHKI
jgi:hypothetical protein